MFIELTKVSGEPVTINVLQIEAVEGPGTETYQSKNEPTSVLVKVNKTDYYVTENYNEIKKLMKNALGGLGMTAATLALVK